MVLFLGGFLPACVCRALSISHFLASSRFVVCLGFIQTGWKAEFLFSSYGLWSGFWATLSGAWTRLRGSEEPGDQAELSHRAKSTGLPFGWLVSFFEGTPFWEGSPEKRRSFSIICKGWHVFTPKGAAAGCFRKEDSAGKVGSLERWLDYWQEP